MEELFLINPTYLDLDDVYRGLPKWKSITVKTTMSDTVLQDMEHIGFVGMILEVKSDASDAKFIKAYKGKHGPCHFTGWNATYTGAALAALDDDNHLIPAGRSIAVCDKTYSIYLLPPFRELISCSRVGPEATLPGNKAMAKESEDFETILEKLFDQLKGVHHQGEPRKALFYPGPFRMLILQDGSVIRRGKINSVAESSIAELVKKDALFKLNDTKEVESEFFQDVYRRHGSVALLKNFNPKPVERPDISTDYSVLASISKKLRMRLWKMLNENRKYFVLIGNEAQDTMGCCPSEEVTEANNLVKRGILDAFSEPVQGDACPVTLYAFRNELQATAHGVIGEPDDAFRSEVKTALRRSSRDLPKGILKWILLVFILISTVVAVRKCNDQRFVSENEQMIVARLNLQQKGRAQVLLFHNEKRCYQCLQMEEYTRGVLDANFAKQLAEGKLAFKTVVIDDPENAGLVSRFGIFAATLVVVGVDQEEEVLGRVLLDAARHYRDEKAFKTYVKSEVEHFLEEINE